MITATYKGKRYEVEYSVVNVSELEGSLRLDAEYYERSYSVYINKVKSCNFSSLKELQEVPTVNGFDYREFSDTGVPYVRVGDIKNFTINLDNSVRVNPKIIPKKIALKKDDILLTRKGTVGEIGLIYSENLKDIIISSEIMRLRLDKEKINPYFVAVFLNSPYGTAQIRQSLHGLAFVSITQDALENIKIPILSDTFQKQIQNLVLQSYDEKEKSVSLYKKAEDTLLEELGLKDWKPKTKKIFVGGKEYEEEENISIRSLSEVLKADRMDAEYWEPKYEDILKTVSLKYDLLPIKSIFDFRRGVFISTDYYTEEKTNRPYIRIKELTGRIGINEDEVIYINDAYQEDVADRLLENDLVIAIIGDTIGKTNRVYEELAGGFCSNNTGRLRIRADAKGKIIPEYAEILFQSIIVQNQIEKKKAQTGQPKISDGEMKSIFIPLLPLEIQQKIASLVQQSHEARKKSKKLLEIAKRAVEIAIEENEDKAKVYMASEKLLSSN
jgi:restriction endonuclease S subunit